jgi:Rad3-related DNA helicase
MASSNDRPQYRLAVRTLTEFVCRRGDIHFRYDAATQGREGIEAQRKLQRGRGPGYQREVKLHHDLHADGFEVVLSGRADGCDLTQAIPLVEEIKATRSDVDALHTHLGHLHFAQLKCYAALLALREPHHSSWQLRLIYVHPDTLVTTCHELSEERGTLLAFLESTLATLVDWLAAERLHRSARDESLRHLQFPFAEFRPRQRQLATAVYRSLRDRQALLAEAPTGCGKTLATVFPALKALAEAHQDRIVYLTSRTTGQRAAELALAQLDPHAALRSVTLTAKARTCFMPEPVCDPERCAYARGYHDRLQPALRELLDGPAMDRTRIEAVAAAHTVCPFELSLDAASWSDVVIGDYNYVFDPVVRLARIRGLFSEPSVLLIDEAHQLTDRTRAMLSSTFSRHTLRQALALDLPADLDKALRNFDRRLVTLRREVAQANGLEKTGYECAIELPERLIGAVTRLAELLASMADHLMDDPTLGELNFALWNLLRAAGWYDSKRFTTLLKVTGREIELEIACLDPGAHIAERLADYAASVRFSATLNPAALFQHLHGLTDQPSVQIASPFPAEHLAIRIVPDISPLYQDRERTLQALVCLIETVVAAKPGNYLIALPSFAYLERVAATYAARFPQRQTRVQQRAMSQQARDDFIARFSAAHKPVVGFVVMGGVFTESVDLPGEALIGIVVVGIGLPPRSLRLDRIAAAHAKDLGFTIAYQQPAMTRVVQTAGRLIRTQNDRGVLCLVDPRYLNPGQRRFFPAHWQPEVVPAGQLRTALDAFWTSA